ncbi:hypothetical protein EXIGLDRAFT_724056 [Exidia glandulosa HHB12029]|uniref:C2H2-type domain-containing protein n=1 Tax=Exidia glandulosa HHB12029 TaxID=1314781 RepID=A0A165EKS1_EXIGL|nr:hypothetical protein EXIGLDRAFT_724056 [Exidia glandulosa HHB12029]
MASSTKRARHVQADDDDSSSASASTSSNHNPPKLARASTEEIASAPLICTLPPTCCPPHGRPTPLKDTRDLEAHYARWHAHVCEADGCGRVFPDARLLELHHTECHDPIAAMRKERGEKIFACHIPTCPKLCATPRTRRLHLIEAHHYPKQYFFAVTNKGIGGLLQQWGEGATLLRGEWKPRAPGDVEEEQTMMQVEEAQQERDVPPHVEDGGAPAAAALTRRQKSRLRQREKRRAQSQAAREARNGGVGVGVDAAAMSVDDADDDDASSSSSTPAPAPAPVPSSARAVRFADHPESPTDDADERPGLGDGMNALVEQLGAMSFVPRNIKFGRGGAMRGFAGGARPGAGDDAMVDGEGTGKPSKAPRIGRGRMRRRPPGVVVERKVLPPEA